MSSPSASASPAVGVVVPFDELPRLPGFPDMRHSWQVYGPGDQFGTLNRLTGPVVAAAATMVRTGERIGLSLPLGVPDPAFFGRQAARHTVFPMGPTAWDDRLDGFYLQCSSQWDGLRHIRAGDDGFYGGWQGRPDDDPGPLGMQHWAGRGIIGRGLLIDLAARGGYDPFSRVAFSVADLEAALRSQGSSLRFGDILCVRTGWIEKYLTLDAAARRELASRLADPNGCTCGSSRAWASRSASCLTSPRLPPPAGGKVAMSSCSPACRSTWLARSARRPTRWRFCSGHLGLWGSSGEVRCWTRMT